MDGGEFLNSTSMFLSDFYNFINKRISPEVFSGLIKEEVYNYEKAKSKLGSSLPIIGGNYEIENFTKVDLIVLFNFYLSGDINEIQLEYILNWLELKDSDYDHDIENVIYSLSDPVINYPINQDNINSAIRFLKGLDNELLLK